jgi:hypothetical protein
MRSPAVTAGSATDGPLTTSRTTSPGYVRRPPKSNRPARLGQLEITFMQVDPVEVDAARRHADRLLIYPLPLEDPDKVAAFGRAARQPLSTLTSIEPNISPLSHS